MEWNITLIMKISNIKKILTHKIKKLQHTAL